jgi:phage shock protein A
MALAVPGSPPGEELRALELLDPVVKNQSAALHGIAFLMVAYIQEQRRLFAQVQGLQQNNQGLQQNVQALQQNVQGLQQKLDALRTLERSLTERREPAPKRK